MSRRGCSHDGEERPSPMVLLGIRNLLQSLERRPNKQDVMFAGAHPLRASN